MARSRYGPSAGEVLSGAAGVFGLVLVLSVYNAFVFKTLFNWFVVPQFGTQPIGFAMAFGLLSLVSLLTTEAPNDDDSGPGVAFAYSAGLSTMALLIGLFAQASL